MGKAIIISHARGGQYTVDIVCNAERIQSLINSLQADRASLQFNDLIDAIGARDAQQGIIDDAAYAVDIAITNFNSSPTEENRQAVEDSTLELLRLSGDYQQAIAQLNFVNSRIASLGRRIATLRDNQGQRRRETLWCADLADGRKDRKIFEEGNTIGTIELTGQEENGQLLFPSYDLPVAQYDSDRDGLAMNVAGLTEFELFYNKAILPGWQKWRQKYKTGMITAGDPETGWTVTLDIVTSTEQNIQVNSFAPDGVSGNGILTEVMADYMSCDNWAFGVGDHVVLSITISGSAGAISVDPLIIGFVDHPRPCIVSGFAYHIVGPAIWQHVSDETGPWIMRTPITSDFITNEGTAANVRSWIGKDENEDPIVLEWAYNGAGIYWSGAQVAEIPVDASWVVLGACITPSKKYMYAIMRDTTDTENVWIMRKSLQSDPLAGEENRVPRNVFLAGLVAASTSVNGEASVNDDKVLSSSIKARAVVTAELSVTHDWERDVLNIGVYAILGEFSFNSACTSALSMYSFTHGAKRSPQVTPGGGASWDTILSNYADEWKEKLEITIENPDADSLDLANVQITNHGRQGYVLQNKYHSNIITAVDGDGIQTGTFLDQRTLSGTYQTGIGYDGDTQIDLLIEGHGDFVDSSGTRFDGTLFTSYFDYVVDHGLRVTGLLPTPIDQYSRVDEMHSRYTNLRNDVYDPYTWATREYTVTNIALGNVKAGDNIGSGNEFQRHYLGEGTYTWTGMVWTSTEEQTDTETGRVYLGEPVAAYPIETAHTDWIDDQPGHGLVFSADTPGYAVETEDVGSELLDVTEHRIDSWSELNGTRYFQEFNCAKGSAHKYMGYWRHRFNLAGSLENDAFLTGGDPFVLDEEADPVIYRSLHPT